MSSFIDAALAVHEDAHKRALSELNDRAHPLRAALAEIESDRESLIRAMQILRDTLATYNGGEDVGAELSPEEDPSDQETEIKSGRARFSDERYLMGISLRQFGAMLDVELEQTTGIGGRDIRKLMKTSIKSGIVVMDGDRYVLTDHGKDLLSRFEELQKSNDKELPELPANHTASYTQSEDKAPNGTMEGVM